MTTFKTLIIAAGLALASWTLSAPVATAQATTVVIIDTQRVLIESAGGRDMAQKLEVIGQAIQSELSTERDALETEGKALQGRMSNLSREALAADTALQSQFAAFQRKQQVFQQKTAIRDREFQQTRSTALAEFDQALGPLIQQVAAERGAQLVLDRTTAIYSDPALDATNLLISKVNVAKPTVNVVRARIQPPQAAPETIQ